MPKKPEYVFPLPRNLYPARKRCVTFQIPDDVDWYMCFWGLLDELTFAKHYQKDSAHNGLIVAAAWKDVIDTARQNFLKRLCDQKTTDTGVGVDEDFMIRQNPDNPCLLETSIDGTNWCAFADLSKCLNAPQTPPTNAPQPPPGGGSQCYDAVMNTNSLYLLPTTVSNGDVITVSAASGATSTSYSARWACPDGSQYFAGACLGGWGFTSGTAPMPSQNVGRLIANLGGTFVDMMAGALTVSGLSSSNQPVSFQVNDATIAGLSGTYQFKACVTNNQTATPSYSTAILYTDYTEHVTPFNTVIGKQYLISCTGYIQNNPYNGSDQFDARYTTSDGWTTQSPTVPSGIGCDFGLLINGNTYPATPDTYSSAHVYQYVLPGTGAPFRFKFCSGNTSGNYGGGFDIAMSTV